MAFLAKLSSCSCEGELCLGSMFMSECSFSWQEKWTELQNGPDVTVITYKNYTQILGIKKFYLRKIFTSIIIYWILSGKNLKQIQFKTLWIDFFCCFIRIKQIALENFSANASELLSTVLRSNKLFLRKCWQKSETTHVCLLTWVFDVIRLAQDAQFTKTTFA